MSKEEIEEAWKEALLTQDTGKLVRLIDEQKNKKVIIDIAQLPISSNFSMEHWLYYFDQLGIVIIDSRGR